MRHENEHEQETFFKNETLEWRHSTETLTNETRKKTLTNKTLKKETLTWHERETLKKNGYIKRRHEHMRHEKEALKEDIKTRHKKEHTKRRH